MVNFESVQWYEKTRRPRQQETEPIVSIPASGRISLNPPAIKLFGDDAPEALQIGYIPDDSVIVLQAAAKGDADSYAITKQGRAMMVNSQKFLAHIGMYGEGKRRYSPSHDEAKGIVYFSLNEPLATTAKGEKSEKKTTTRKSGK